MKTVLEKSVEQRSQFWACQEHTADMCIDIRAGCRYVEVMAPVFSRAAWRCVWHMIQVTIIFYKLNGQCLPLALQISSRPQLAYNSND